MTPGRGGLLHRIREWRDRRTRRRERALEPFPGTDDDLGGSGVREPRRPRPPHLSGGVALEEPETRDE